MLLSLSYFWYFRVPLKGESFLTMRNVNIVVVLKQGKEPFIVKSHRLISLLTGFGAKANSGNYLLNSWFYAD